MFRIAPLFAVLALTGCATDTVTTDHEAFSVDVDRAPAPPSDVVLEVGELTPGLPGTFVVTDALPGETVKLAAGIGGLGPGPCLAPAGGLCLDIQSPAMLFGSGTADASGEAVLEIVVPPSLAIGDWMAFQAVLVRGPGGVDSVASNAVAAELTAGEILVVDDLRPGDLVVTEVMRNPEAVSDADGEWFEVYNASGLAIDLEGLVVRDDGTNSFTVTSPLLVDADSYVVFGSESDMALNGGVTVDYDWSSFTLGNTDDEILLEAGATTVDALRWDGDFPEPEGASMQVDPGSRDGLSNDVSSAWCESTRAYGDGDLGSPGLDNAPCPEPAGPEVYTGTVEIRYENLLPFVGGVDTCSGSMTVIVDPTSGLPIQGDWSCDWPPEDLLGVLWFGNLTGDVWGDFISDTEAQGGIFALGGFPDDIWEGELIGDTLTGEFSNGTFLVDDYTGRFDLVRE